MNRLVGNLVAEAKRHLVIHYVIVPILTPLFFAGFVLGICIISLMRKESVYPSGPPFGLHEPVATSALAILCHFVPLPYVACILKMRRDSQFCGHTRQFWRILIVSAFASALTLALIFGLLILVIFPHQ
jgi:hypothetical protein